MNKDLPAFPCEWGTVKYPGLTKAELFALVAMAAIILTDDYSIDESIEADALDIAAKTLAPFA